MAHGTEGDGMSGTGFTVAMSAGIGGWAAVFTGICRWYWPEWAAIPEAVLLGSFLVAVIVLVAHRMQTDPARYECRRCHGRYLHHEVEPVGATGEAWECESCLTPATPSYPEVA